MKFKSMTVTVFVFSIAALFSWTHSDVNLYANKDVQRGCWQSHSVPSDEYGKKVYGKGKMATGLWLRCKQKENFQDDNFDYLEWTFEGDPGTYELWVHHIAHFSGKSKYYVTHNGKTVHGPKQSPISKTGWCCASPGSSCRKKAADNLHLEKTKVKIKAKPGDKIRYYGNMHFGCKGHGNYAGVFQLWLKGDGEARSKEDEKSTSLGQGASQVSLIAKQGPAAFSVGAENRQNYRVEILNASGMVVKTIEASGPKTFDFQASLEPGYYSARINGFEEQVESIALVVLRL